jgi:hypothetical protein
MNILTY